MNLLKTIKDVDFRMDYPAPTKYLEREAARAIVFDRDKNIALLHVTKKNYHKIPGGGLEKGEDIGTALRRELIEETGCSVENVRELGIVEEFRNQLAIHQTSYCFIADQAGVKGTPGFMEDEVEDEFKLEWVSLKEAIRKLEQDKGVEDYEGKFIRLRDLTFLKEIWKTKENF